MKRLFDLLLILALGVLPGMAPPTMAGASSPARGTGILVADTYNHRIVWIQDISARGWASLGRRGAGVAEFAYPTTARADPTGHIYVADGWNSRVARVNDISGRGWTTLGRRGDRPGQFAFPMGIAFDAAGRIYVADYGNYRIVRMDNIKGGDWVVLGHQIADD